MTRKPHGLLRAREESSAWTYVEVVNVGELIEQAQLPHNAGAQTTLRFQERLHIELCICIIDVCSDANRRHHTDATGPAPAVALVHHRVHAKLYIGRNSC